MSETNLSTVVARAETLLFRLIAIFRSFARTTAATVKLQMLTC